MGIEGSTCVYGPIIEKFDFIVAFFIIDLGVCLFFSPGLNFQDWIMIALSVSVVVVTAIALIFYR